MHLWQLSEMVTCTSLMPIPPSICLHLTLLKMNASLTAAQTIRLCIHLALSLSVCLSVCMPPMIICESVSRSTVERSWILYLQQQSTPEEHYIKSHAYSNLGSRQRTYTLVVGYVKVSVCLQTIGQTLKAAKRYRPVWLWPYHFQKVHSTSNSILLSPTSVIGVANYKCTSNNILNPYFLSPV